MYVPNLELCGQIEELRRDDERRQAEAWRLWRQVRLAEPSWLARQGCRLLCQLGRALVRAGRQLEGYGLSRHVVTDASQ
jgi:hypothetical protein